MTEQESNELVAKLSGMLQTQRAGTIPSAPPMMAPMGMMPAMMPQAAGPAISSGPVGLLVAITIPTPNGEVSGYLQLGPEALGNPQGAIMALMQAGWPVRCYQRSFGGGGANGFQGARQPFQRWGGGGGGGWR